ncbi:MAG: S8 family serine peptidase [Oscillospiraceae bacterium]|nr:S8 family serine peptidase [Oscillospiraceae bacterium]
MHKNVSKVLALLLCLCLLLTGAPGISALAVGNDADQTESPVEDASQLKDLDPSTLGVRKLGEIDEAEEAPAVDPSTLTPDTSLKELVRVSIFLTEPSAIDAGYSAQGIGSNGSAASYRASLLNQQKSVQSAIENRLGYELNVVWNLTLLTNAFSTWVYGKDIPFIERMDGVAAVQRENMYTVPETDGAQPDTANTSTGMVGASQAWASGYTGAGTRIAIIDTGIDTQHRSFDAEAFDYAIAQYQEQTGKTVDLMTEADIPASGLNGSGTYLSSKIPYAYNYVDENQNVDHLGDRQGEHGSHVAGIAAANRFVKDGDAFADAAETVHAVGMAPDAQLLVMKVFGSSGGAYDSDYFAAIEDAVFMEADSVNLSLGSAAPGFTYDNYYQDILNNLADGETNAGTVTVMSAGNSGSFIDGSPYYTNYGIGLFIEDVSLHTGGSPGSFINSLGVASANNIGKTGAPLTFNGSQDVYITESASSGGSFAGIVGSYDFVYIDSIGSAEDYAAANEAVSLTGKILIVNRGSLNFTDKGNNAIPYSPAGLLVANNQPGTIGMQLDAYTGTFPMAAITLADANALKSASTQTAAGDLTCYTGTVVVSETIKHGTTGDRSDAEMSSFSSWGVPGSLLMKPEITAPGGDIYSVFGTSYSPEGNPQGGTDQYELLSGTSMAAPHISGLSALTAQYLKETDYAAANPALASNFTRRAIIQSLLMSTATPMKTTDGEDEYYVSILQQGAGLADVSRAVNASSVIMMKDAGLTTSTGAAADGKVKAELGDDPDRTGKYSYSFTVYNLTDTDLSYNLSTDVFTQHLYQNYNFLFMDKSTVGLAADVSYAYEQELTETHDVNKDGMTTDADAQAILDYLSGEADGAAFDLEAGEMDDDGTLSTHDAHLLLQFAGSEGNGLVVKAGSSKDVTVSISIDADYMAFLDTYYTSGAYIEGFTRLECNTTTAENVAVEDVHTIPVLGFYGSWTDASMFDNTSYTDTLYGTDKINYSGNEYTNYLTMKYGSSLSKFTGNPYIVEEEFPADALAVNSGSQFVNLYYNLIRSAGTTGFAVTKTDEFGGNVTDVLDSTVKSWNETSLYYHVNEGSWQNTGTKTQAVNKTAASYGLAEGDTFRIGYYAIPEYYGMLVHKADMTAPYAGNLDPDNDEFDAVLKSNVLGRGAFVGYDFTIDDTIPAIDSAVLEGTDIKVTAGDNQNLAYVAILSLDGGTVYAETAPHNMSFDGSFDATQAIEEAEGYVAIFAADYAGNEVAKALKVNDNESIDPLAIDSISISPASVELYVGNEMDLSAEILPLTVEDRRITWTSSDDSVVTVDDAGHIKAVGAGSASVIAAAASDETKKAECSVTVVSIDKAMNAIVWDENGEVFFSGFNTNALPTWTKLHDSGAEYAVQSTLLDDEGTLYAATFDSSSESSALFTVDPGTYGLTEYGDNYVGATDMAIGSTYFADYTGMVYTYAPFLVAGNLAPADPDTTDDVEEYYTGIPWALMDARQTEIKDAYLAAVATKTRTPYGGDFYVLDENGVIWETSLALNADQNGFEFSAPVKVLETGIATNFLYQDLYFDGTWLYWSHYDGTVSTLYAIDPVNKTVYDTGNFGEGVWPVSGLYVQGQAAPASTGGGAKIDAVNVQPLNVSRDELMTREIANRIAAAAGKTPAGGTNTVGVREKDYVPGVTDRQTVEGEAALIDEEGRTAVVALTDDEDVTNGLVRVSYTEGLTYLDTVSPLYYSAHVDEEAHTVTIAYASAATVPQGTEFADLVFEVEDASQIQHVNVVTAERNANADIAEDPTVIDIGEPEEAVPSFKTKSLILSGELGVNFFMDLPAIDGVDYTDSYVEFTVTGKGGKTTVDPFDPNHKNVSGEYYGFTCYVNSIQMAETITAVFHYGSDDKTVTTTYSVKEYIEGAEANKDKMSEAAYQLIHSIADYGHYVQRYLSAVNHWEIGVDYADMDLYFTDSYDIDAIKAAVSEYTMTKQFGTSKVTKATHRLHLDSSTALEVFLTVEGDTELTASIQFKGNTYTAEKQADGRYSIKIPNISAHQLGNIFTITGNAGGEFTVTASVMSYINAVLSSGNADEATQNGLASLYTYYEKAIALLG